MRRWRSVDLTKEGKDFVDDAQFIVDMVETTISRYVETKLTRLTVRVGSVDFQ